MNIKMIARTLGFVLCALAALLSFPFLVALIFGESPHPYLITALISAVLGISLIFIRPGKRTFYAGEGFITVALSWLLVSLVGALPFVISGSIPSYIDAFFETVSGFTTTGASILTEVETLPYGILFWRSFTHWIGGMGVLVFVMALVPQANPRSIHVLRAEVPGISVGKLVPKAQYNSLWLYSIYLVLTLAEIVFLIFGGMSVFDSVVNSFASAGTGGFSVRNVSIAAYRSPYCEYVIAIFMLLFGVNFNLYFLILMKNAKQAFKSEELWVYIGIIMASTAAITANILSVSKNFSDALCKSFFQVSSIITTTGFSTADFNLWPALSKFILFGLMFIGACGGSTGGAIKVSRFVIILKKIYYDLIKMVHPKAVTSIRLDGKVIDGESVVGVSVFFNSYLLITAVTVLLVSLDGFDFETTLTSVVACIGNIGPGFGKVGPMGNFSEFSYASKLLLSLAMFLGRLEIYPLLIFISPALYKKN